MIHFCHQNGVDESDSLKNVMEEVVMIQINFLQFRALETLKHLLLPYLCACAVQ